MAAAAWQSTRFPSYRKIRIDRCHRADLLDRDSACCGGSARGGRGALTLFCLAALVRTRKHPSPVPVPRAGRAGLHGAGRTAPAAGEWPRWIAAADAATRARVAKGDETSIVNLLMFGTSFTRQPRMTSRQLDGTEIRAGSEQRLDDFERALAKPERTSACNSRAGASARGSGAAAFALDDRSRNEGGATHARLTEEAHALGDPSLEFAERSRLYRGRGLASDTSVRVNFAIEEALRGSALILARVRRVAVIGPGLDVVDKQEGHDFYPPQTIQPFAADRLAGSPRACRCRYAPGHNPRRERQSEQSHRGDGASSGAPYVMHIPLDGDGRLDAGAARNISPGSVMRWALRCRSRFRRGLGP